MNTIFRVKPLLTAALLFGGTIVGTVAHAANEDKNRLLFDMMKTMFTSSPDNEMAITAKCLGLSKAKLDSIVDRAMQGCFDRHKSKATAEFQEQFSQCLEPAIVKASGFSQAKIDACEPKNEAAGARGLADKHNTRLDQVETQIEALQQQLDEMHSGDASDSEIAAIEDKLEALEERDEGSLAAGDYDDYIAAQRQQVAKTLATVAKASEKLLPLVNLPIYKNSQVMMVSVDSMEIQGEKTLPAATFVSPDASEKILAYYRQQLPKFIYKNMGNGEHLLMESMPGNFDMLRHMKVYMTTPHVYIRGVENGQALGMPKGMKSNIELAYRGKP